MVGPRQYLMCVALIGCSTPTTDPVEDPVEIGPAPWCGDGSPGPSGGCAAWELGCFGWARLENLNSPGYCFVSPTEGTVHATLDGVDLVAAQATGFVDGSVLAISARLGDELIVVFAPATPGVHDCASPYALAGIGYFMTPDGRPTVDFRSVALAGVQPVCSVTVDSVGDVGQRLVGSFSATLVQWRYDPATGLPPATLELANGTFSVARALIP